MAIDYGMPVVFSLEMASVQLITFISSETGLSSEKLRREAGKARMEQLSTKVKNLESAFVY
jgi:replicative DNA helicase